MMNEECLNKFMQAEEFQPTSQSKDKWLYLWI